MTPRWPRNDLEPVDLAERKAADQRLERIALNRPITSARYGEDVTDDQLRGHAAGLSVSAREQT